MNRRGFFRGLLAAAGLAAASHYAPSAVRGIAAPWCAWLTRYEEALRLAVAEMTLDWRVGLDVFGSVCVDTRELRGELLRRAARIISEGTDHATFQHAARHWLPFSALAANLTTRD